MRYSEEISFIYTTCLLVAGVMLESCCWCLTSVTREWNDCDAILHDAGVLPYFGLSSRCIVTSSINETCLYISITMEMELKPQFYCQPAHVGQEISIIFPNSEFEIVSLYKIHAL